MTDVKAQTITRGGARYYVVVDAGGEVRQTPSVNTVNGAVKNVAIATWSENRLMQAAFDHPELAGDMNFVAYKRFLRAEAKKDTAAIERGNRIHEVCEAYFLGAVQEHPEAEWLVPLLDDFRVRHGVEHTHVERAMAYIDHHGVPVYAGTADFIGTFDGTLSVLDWKSGKSIHSDAALTTSAYALCNHWIVDGLLVPMSDTEKPRQAVVVHVTDVELIPHRVASVEAFRPIWHSLRTVHDWLTNPPAVWA